MTDMEAPLPEDLGINEERQFLVENIDNDPLLAKRIFDLWWHWADFHLYIIAPVVSAKTPPQIIVPEEVVEGGEKEFVYPIIDYGFKLSTSKGLEMYSAGKSMCKLYFTIEKMIQILVERLKEAGGVTQETEVQIAFGGFELAQRKAFEVIINLNYNVVVTNFDPGVWGENYLEAVKKMSEKGYGYPMQAPRDTYRHIHGTPQSIKRKV